MHEMIKNFNKQFLFEPEIINSEKLTHKSEFVVVGMGGSALSALLLKTYRPELDIIVHSNYGLPEMTEEKLKNKLIILSSYSGNTEEVIDAFNIAKEKELEMVVIATGGKLLELAKENNTPYIQLPIKVSQPRWALGFSTKAFLKIIDEKELEKISELAGTLDTSLYEEKGKELAKKIKDHVPVIYASENNSSLAYNWKIKFDENSKIPAFCNTFPELNHNEMTGFDIKDTTKELDKKFFFIFLKDKEDDERITKRMEVLEKMYEKENLKVEVLELEQENSWHKIFSILVLADWVSYYTALGYGIDPEQIPMVEDFKKLILK
ncbi:MAG: bifunctional phosphoglucose/phosphomannose isomerase [Candidatus Paceibacterota bacterium]|jgi:glucose/mannose-6-phosphate isomerase